MQYDGEMHSPMPMVAAENRPRCDSSLSVRGSVKMKQITVATAENAIVHAAEFVSVFKSFAPTRM